MLCNICGSDAVESFQTSDQKIYWNCSHCGGKFLDKDFLLKSNDEKERYLEHNNEIDDPTIFGIDIFKAWGRITRTFF